MRTKELLKTIFLFIICFNVFYAIQANAPSINGADGFYHIKVADLMKEEGLIEEFPWMQHSVMNDYADLMFLYHALLIPFTFFGLELGAKLSAVVFSSLMICAGYWLLRRFKIKYSFLWALLLLGSGGFFLYRLSLPKAVPLSIIFSFIGIYFIIKRKPKSLLVLSFLYAWLYTIAPMLLVFALIDSAIIFVRRKKVKVKLPVFCAIGLVLGFVINPYFPRNIYLWYIQTVKVALFPVQNLNLGVEWLSYDLITFATVFIITILLFLAGLVCFYFSQKKKDSTIFLLIISALFFAISLKSKRYAEYFVPFAWLFFVFSFAGLKMIYHKVISNRFFIIASTVSVILLVAVSFSDVSANIKGDRTALNIYRYGDCAEWLAENTLEKTIVLSHWDAFSPLFFYNDQNYYVNGLDPAFLYFYSPELYNNYIDIFSGRSSSIEAFNAEYVVSKKELPGFETVFSTDFCYVLKSRP